MSYIATLKNQEDLPASYIEWLVDYYLPSIESPTEVIYQILLRRGFLVENDKAKGCRFHYGSAAIDIADVAKVFKNNGFNAFSAPFIPVVSSIRQANKIATEFVQATTDKPAHFKRRSVNSSWEEFAALKYGHRVRVMEMPLIIAPLITSLPLCSVRIRDIHIASKNDIFEMVFDSSFSAIWLKAIFRQIFLTKLELTCGWDFIIDGNNQANSTLIISAHDNTEREIANEIFTIARFMQQMALLELLQKGKQAFYKKIPIQRVFDERFLQQEIEETLYSTFRRAEEVKAWLNYVISQ